MRLHVDGLCRKYPGPGGAVVALENIQLQLAAGEFLALGGASGCGKSTLLLTIGGLLRPDHGTVLVAGQDIYKLSSDERATFRAHQIGFVFQQFHLVPYLNVIDNVMASTLGLAKEERRDLAARAVELLETVGLTNRVKHLPGALSTGERQRTALARALLNNPILLLADEPTGNLDPENTDTVLRALRAYAQQGGSVLLATHDEQAAQSADRMVFMAAGQLCGRE